MSGPTPGEWTVSEDIDDGFGPGYIDSEKGIIAAMFKQMGRSSEEQRANAHLIAASKELLEALKVILAPFGDTERNMERAYSAIAKAEGREVPA